MFSIRETPAVRAHHLNHFNFLDQDHSCALASGFFGRSNTLILLSLVTKVAVVTQQSFRTLLLEPEYTWQALSEIMLCAPE